MQSGVSCILCVTGKLVFELRINSQPPRIQIFSRVLQLGSANLVPIYSFKVLIGGAVTAIALILVIGRAISSVFPRQAEADKSR